MAAVQMDQAAIQLLIDAAVNAVNVQHQADLQAANDANAAALLAAIAALPAPTAGGAAGVG